MGAFVFTPDRGSGPRPAVIMFMAVHDPAGAERHRRELTALFDETLKEPVAA